MFRALRAQFFWRLTLLRVNLLLLRCLSNGKNRLAVVMKSLPLSQFITHRWHVRVKINIEAEL